MCDGDIVLVITFPISTTDTDHLRFDAHGEDVVILFDATKTATFETFCDVNVLGRWRRLSSFSKK